MPTRNEDMNMNEAQQMTAQFPNATDLMSALDSAGVPSDQDWEHEATTWTLSDGSKIGISGPVVTVD
jgi:hypothetical protein